MFIDVRIAINEFAHAHADNSCNTSIGTTFVNLKRARRTEHSCMTMQNIYVSAGGSQISCTEAGPHESY